jgi:hypothetical protein
METMQKIVGVYLKAWAPRLDHRATEELLQEYLQDGWRVTGTAAAGGASDGQGVGVWIVFTLEK